MMRIFALVFGIGWLIGFLVAVRRVRRMVQLTPQTMGEDEPHEWPPVCIVVAARNEAETIADAMTTLLHLDYPDYQVIAVDDRSGDQTGQILAQMAGRISRLQVIHIDHLPRGWLGKTHALHRGAAAADAAWLLFTDADVRFHPKTLKVAIVYALERGLDHLTLGPRLNCRGGVLGSVFVAFSMLFGLLFDPDKVSDPRSKTFVGIGAFNLVRASVYQAIGGHRSLALCPIDDVWLGRRIKEAGYRQGYAYAPALLQVAWYTRLSDMARGLEKNALAAFGYRVSPFILFLIFHLIVVGGPVAGLIAGGLSRGLIFLPAVFFEWLTHLFVAVRVLNFPIMTGVLGPLGQVLMNFMMFRAGLLTLFRGKVRWRGDDYDLKVLRQFLREKPWQEAEGPGGKPS